MYEVAHLLCRKCRKTHTEAVWPWPGEEKPFPCPACGTPMYWMPKPLMLPEVTRLSELFDGIKVRASWDEKSPFPAKSFEAQAWKWNSRKKATVPRPCRVPVSAYLGTGYVRYPDSNISRFDYGVWIRPSEALVRAVSKGWIGDAERERVSIQAITRNDGTVLITSDNSLILASRWVALLDVSAWDAVKEAI